MRGRRKFGSLCLVHTLMAMFLNIEKKFEIVGWLAITKRIKIIKTQLNL